MSDSEDSQDKPDRPSGHAAPGQPPLPLQMPVAFAPTALQAISVHQGPLPPPQVLDAYEKAHPGAATWILAEARASAEHVRRMEELAIRIQGRDAGLHRLLPFALVAAFLAASVLLAWLAGPAFGAAAFFSTLASVVIAYLRGAQANPRRSSRPENHPQHE